MTVSVDDFEPFHTAVHGSPPFEWQSRLLREVVSRREWPRVLDLPTGTGKTTCVDIALFALALDAGAEVEKRWCPRRIAMVVDRRVVVDQVAERGRKLARTLSAENPSEVVARVATALRSLGSGEEPVGVFTLRGGMPKDDCWARTPDQPLILASTVDQLGSRLFVQGYGVSRGMRPVHAGLLGNDTLVLLDEVHLSHPFEQTLEALAELRELAGSKRVLPSRFAHAFLSATPGETDRRTFRLEARERSSRSALGARLHAKKPARLVAVTGRAFLEERCAEEAAALSQRHSVVGVVLNRVASALNVAALLRGTIGDGAQVRLLTGRMRPLDRDDALRELRPRVLAGRERRDVDSKLVLVATQCIEAGADFDLDALVTESASIDALRQRFGRVDRLGSYGHAEAVIVHDSAEKDDPIYGGAIVETMGWLKAQLSRRGEMVDFGSLALPNPPTEAIAPKKSAPILMPAYLDLWSQTSPEPAAVPDLGLFLHGPASGPPDVQVVWRADLTERDLDEASLANAQSAQELTAIVGALRPSSLEAISLPFVAAKRWLAETSDLAALDVADVESQADDDDESSGGRRALRWRGDESSVITAEQLRPGDTIVVPSERGGIATGCFDSSSRAPVRDIAERAALFARGQPVLRLNSGVLTGLGLADAPLEDLAETRSWLRERADAEVDWKKPWLSRVSRSRRRIVVNQADGGWIVLEGGRLTGTQVRALLLLEDCDTVEDGVELTTDDDDSSYTGVETSLAEHSGDVERFARDYATRVGLGSSLVSDLALAGWLHDIGKADRRFQLMLRGGSEIDLFKDETVWAKSPMPRGDREAHRRAQQLSGYPKGTRHEVQSLAMIEQHRDAIAAKATDLDLVLHLVASHHGYCRPFAPVVDDAAPVAVSLQRHQSDVFGRLDFGPTSSKNDLHRLGSALGDRYWLLVERYGWLELCWLEAILRLADHRASEMEQHRRDAS